MHKKKEDALSFSGEEEDHQVEQDMNYAPTQVEVLTESLADHIRGESKSRSSFWHAVRPKMAASSPSELNRIMEWGRRC